MSLTLTAVFDEPTGTVELQATSDTDHAYGAWDIVRSDANGSATVRTQEGLGFSSGVLNVIDNEPALAGLVSYTIVAAAETAAASIMASTVRTWLKYPIKPHLSIEIGTLSATYEGAYTPEDNVFTPLDRDDPIIVFGAFGLRSGRFEVLCDTYEQALTIVNAYKATRVALLQAPAPSQVSMYHAVRRLALRPFAPLSTRWVISGEYIEVARPVGPVLGTLGWAYTDVAADYTTYLDLIVAFDTYNDVTVGP